MATKSNKNVPKSLSTYKAGNNSYEMKKTSTIIKRDKHSGSSSTKFSQTKKVGGFIDKKSGNSGYKEQLNWKTTHMINDKAKGYTKEYQIEVKVKETTTYPKNIKNYSYNKLVGNGIIKNMK